MYPKGIPSAERSRIAENENIHKKQHWFFRCCFFVCKHVKKFVIHVDKLCLQWYDVNINKIQVIHVSDNVNERSAIMAKDESVVKSFRTTEEQFARANEIFHKEGFSFSEAIRLLFEATIREGQIPRCLSTRDMEDRQDAARKRDEYISGILDTAIPNFDGKFASAEERLLACIFGQKQNASDMSNAELREWAGKWGLPDNLSIATLADLYDCGFFAKDPWFGEYKYHADNGSDEMKDAAVVHRFEMNLMDNLSQLKRSMQVRAVKFLMEYDNETPEPEIGSKAEETED